MAGKKVKTGYELSGVLTEIGKKLEKDLADKFLKKLSLDAFEYLVNKTAWETGFLRSRWDVATNIYPPDEMEKHPGGNSYRAAAFPPVRIMWGDTVYLFNNVEYAKYLETGTPKMRAQPMVAPAYQAVLLNSKMMLSKLNKRKIP